MKVKDLRKVFIHELQALYGISEIQEFYARSVEVYTGCTKGLIDQNREVDVDVYSAVIQRLKAKEPIQYILHSAPFYGRNYFVDSSVLIPRPETEELVHWVTDDLKHSTHRILDVGTGSGCIAISLSLALKNSVVVGCDISEESLKIARRNASQFGASVEFRCCDLNCDQFDSFDVIVSNPPYIGKSEMAEMEENVLDYEPHLALFVENEDPLKPYYALIRGLKSCGYFEINNAYQKNLEEWLIQQGYRHEFRKDLNGHWRMLKVVA